MTELEMASVLGLLLEPERNRVNLDTMTFLEMMELKITFIDIAEQKKLLGTVNRDIWCELLPWHSMN